MSALPPLGIYVHWPYCARICPYCDFAVKRDRSAGEEPQRLAGALLRDLEVQSRGLSDRALVSVFFGGGTPSLMAPGLIAEFLSRCRSIFSPAAPLEVTLEANPTDAEADRFEEFAAAGVTRLSLGVQSFSDAALEFLGRSHSGAAARRAASLAARIFGRVSLDLIYALPGQSEEGFREDLAIALGYGVEHLSAYELTIEPGTAFDRAVRRGRFEPSDPDRSARFYEIKAEVLEGAGFDAYEVSNHARGAAAACRHNLLYWRGEDYLGIGPSAHGRLTGPDARVATRAAPSVAAYLDTVARTGSGPVERHALSAVERAEERLLMGLRTQEGVDLGDLAPLGLRGLEDLKAGGFIDVAAGRIRASDSGRLVLNRVVELLAD